MNEFYTSEKSKIKMIAMKPWKYNYDRKQTFRNQLGFDIE